ncbi:hypothetical protein CDL12_23848 [Handroanthus impetiginosus]|uniref:DC1 domain-containing protein n=1 Tax=Handroanthus impetiginosus TaxID=429701 RepID=A0A2G9GEH2_9LAMI|nr:hypothetical protein CDL12_23848 [Handroanthus impetiginosus]
MGKIEAESSINHFSHPHPMRLVSFTSSTAKRITCSSCTNEASGLVYICESCNYCLHKPCSDMPLNLSHQVDQEHTLTLLPKGGAFQCNACGALGTGFCYHCAACDLDLHTVCAFMRPSVKGAAHVHTLKLYFEPPYENRAFMCDVCGESGSNHWLYRCDLCQFDAHLKCAKKQPQIDRKLRSDSRIEKGRTQIMVKPRSVHFPTSSGSQTQHQLPVIESYRPGSLSPGQIQFHNTSSVFTTPTFVPPPLPLPLQLQPPPPQRTRNGTSDNVVQNILEGLVEGAASAFGQALMQGVLGN